jgi:hypothetical protein
MHRLQHSIRRLLAVDQAQTLYTQCGLAKDSLLQIMQVGRIRAQEAQPEIGEERMSRFRRVLQEQLGLNDAGE